MVLIRLFHEIAETSEAPGYPEAVESNSAMSMTGATTYPSDVCWDRRLPAQGFTRPRCDVALEIRLNRLRSRRQRYSANAPHG